MKSLAPVLVVGTICGALLLFFAPTAETSEPPPQPRLARAIQDLTRQLDATSSAARLAATNQKRRADERGERSRAAAAAPTPTKSSEAAAQVYAQPSCNPVEHAGYSGGSLNWGMSFHVATATECCEACHAHAKVCVAGAAGKVYMRRKWEGKQVDERCAKEMTSNELGVHSALPCNVWVYCPTPRSAGGLCWSNDVWNHTSGECWLKNQADPARPHAGAYGAYPAKYRQKHRTAPELVQWMSGSLTGGKSVTVDGPHWHW